MEELSAAVRSQFPELGEALREDRAHHRGWCIGSATCSVSRALKNNFQWLAGAERAKPWSVLAGENALSAERIRYVVDALRALGMRAMNSRNSRRVVRRVGESVLVLEGALP